MGRKERLRQGINRYLSMSVGVVKDMGHIILEDFVVDSQIFGLKIYRRLIISIIITFLTV